MYRRSIRTIVVRNLDWAAANANVAREIPIPSRSGSPYYRIVGVRGVVVSGSTFSSTGLTWSCTTDNGNNVGNGGRGNLIASGNLGAIVGTGLNTSLGQSGGNGNGNIIWTAGWVQSSPSLFIRMTGFVSFSTLVMDFQIDIEDMGQAAPPVVSDNTMARMRQGNSQNVQISRIQVANMLMYMLAPNYVTWDNVTKNTLVIFDLSTGAALSFNVTVAGGSILDFAVDASNGDVYIVGSFTSVNGTARNRAACVDSTGTLKAWNPDVAGASFGAGPFVNRVVLSAGVLYFCGAFATVGGVARNSLASMSTAGTLGALSVTLTRFANFGFALTAICIYQGNVIFGGNILSVNGTARVAIAMVDASGTLLSWAPNIGPLDNFNNSQPVDIITDNVSIFVTGGITPSPTFRRGIAKYDSAGVLVAAFNANVPNNGGLSINGISLDGNYLAYGPSSNTNSPLAFPRIVDATTGADTGIASFQPGLRPGAQYISQALGLYVCANLAFASCMNVLRFKP
jgi:hypothetical protein